MARAPVALFAFNRPDHTARTLEALSRNALAAETDVFAFLDGPRPDNAEDPGRIAQTQAVLARDWGFNSLNVTRSPVNQGLARSIVAGVGRVCRFRGRVIVLEDDLVTSEHFLTFMNEGLTRYANTPAVWHISGFNEIVGLPHREGDAYLQRAASSWGWATWEDRWRHFRKDAPMLKAAFTKELIAEFDLAGTHPKWQEVEANLGGYIDSWAIFWYATVFANNGLCLYPTVSYVENIGFDGTGVHCGIEPSRTNGLLNTRSALRFPTVIREDAEIVAALKKLYRRRYLKRVLLPALGLKLKRAPNWLLRHTVGEPMDDGSPPPPGADPTVKTKIQR